jgi:hypothetical protein
MLQRFRACSPAVTATAAAVALAGCAAWSGPVEFFVAPDGQDAAAGTRAAPFASLVRAREALREVRRANGGALPGPATVWLRGGLYELPETFALAPTDGGTAAAPVTFSAVPDEVPILSGGHVVRGWVRQPAGHWSATLPTKAGEPWVVNQLFARRQGEGWYERRWRPTRGLFVIAGLTDAPHRDPKGRIDHRNPQQEVSFRPGDVQAWENLEDVELLFLHDWSSGRMRIAHLDLEQCIVRFTEFPHYRIGHWYPAGRNPYLVENLKEDFGKPGEWYFDRPTGLLLYTPLPDEDMGRSQFVVPRLERLVALTGDLKTDAFVEHISFRGIQFAHSAWRLPPHLYAEGFGRACRQGFVDMPAAVECRAARHCRFERCHFTNLGAYGVDLGDGCHENTVEGNLMVDLGTGGVKVGTVDRTASYPLLPTANVVANNLISEAGLVHYSGHGIWGGICARTQIRHNLVTRTFYSAIAVGWSHDTQETGCRENLIEFNHVHDVMLLLDHGAGIYTLGNQPGTVIRGNLIHDTHQTRLHGAIRRPDWTAGGLGFDDGSSNFVVEDNVLYDLPVPPALALTEGRAKEMTVRNNVCGIRPGEAGFPAEAAARAGLEARFRDLLQVPFRVSPSPILAMSLPPAGPPPALVDTFDKTPVGQPTVKGYCRLEDKAPGKGTDAIVVTDETAAEGPHSLKIVDAPGLSQPWIPYLSYSPGYSAGLATVAFCLRLGTGAEIDLAWRGRHPTREFSVGPQMLVKDGSLQVGGKAVGTVPLDTWVRIEVKARLGALDPGIGSAGATEYGVWQLRFEVPGRDPLLLTALPHGSPEFRDLTQVMFISTATQRAVFYLDSVRITCE